MRFFGRFRRKLCDANAFGHEISPPGRETAAERTVSSATAIPEGRQHRQRRALRYRVNKIRHQKAEIDIAAYARRPGTVFLQSAIEDAPQMPGWVRPTHPSEPVLRRN
jgi:hypothetical protein